MTLRMEGSEVFFDEVPQCQHTQLYY
jgi:hypothetical protein